MKHNHGTKLSQTLIVMLSVVGKKIIKKVLETEPEPEKPKEATNEQAHEFYGRPIEEAALLAEADSVPRRFKIGKGMHKVEPTDNGDIEVHRNDLIASDRHVELSGFDIARMGKIANAAFAIIASVGAVLFMISYIGEAEVSSLITSIICKRSFWDVLAKFT